MMRKDVLDRLLKRTVDLISASGREVPSAVMDSFSAGMLHLREWDTFRINPVNFATANDLPLQDVLRLFIYGTKAGLFSFEWSLLCPMCGGREHSHGSLDQLARDAYHCTVCDIDVAVEADDHLEVCFTVNPEVSGFIPDPHASWEQYARYYFSANFRHPEGYAELLKTFPKRRFIVLDPGARARFRMREVPIGRYRLISLDTHSIYSLYFRGGGSSVSLRHGESGFERASDEVGHGDVELVLENRSAKRTGFDISAPDSPRIAEFLTATPPTFAPFVSGRMMLNNQSFRELFLVDNLPDSLSLKVRDITLMFTDLKGSTEMYSRTGDVHAYRLVQRHFDILKDMVAESMGAIVKTMGDAIMASFCNPSDAMRAASRMLEEIENFNASISGSGNSIGLKIGLHRGPVIAVKANQTLDYFGQTVNVAARIQGLAESGEIWMSDDIWQDAAVQEIARDHRYRVTPDEKSLKGVGAPVKVYQCCHE